MPYDRDIMIIIFPAGTGRGLDVFYLCRNFRWLQSGYPKPPP